jgi:uncharacterized membrane protein YhaH (DUF805 family)
MRWMIMPFRKYADFTGRSQRKEYWMFFLFSWLVCVPLLLFIGMQGEAAEAAKKAGDANSLAQQLVDGSVVILMLFLVAIIVPSLAVTVRRLHDQDKPGWVALMTFIPYVGWLVLLWFMASDGNAGANRYGLDPKGRGNDDDGDIDYFSTAGPSPPLRKAPARLA